MTEQEMSKQKSSAILCHASAFLGFIIPLAHILAPLIIWQSNKKKGDYVDEQGKEALNFQITITIFLLIPVLFMVLGAGQSVFGATDFARLLVFLIYAITLFDIVMIIIAMIKVSKEEQFSYPVNIRFIS